MVGSTGTLMTMRLVRSKLRKREESSATAAQTANNATTITANNIEAQTVSFGLQSRTNSYNNNNNNNNIVQYNNYNNCNGGNYERQQQVCNSNNNSNATTPTTPTTPTITLNGVDNTQTTILTTTTTTTTAQGQDQVDQVVTFTRTNGIGSNGNVNNTNWVFPPKAPTPNIYNCMNNDALLTVNEKNGFKGLGFRRQLSGRFKRLVTKKPEPTPVIPPELKPQLKTIYVY